MVGEILQELRKDKGITQADLSKVVGVSPSTIGSYETETVEPPLSMLLKLADYFGVTLDYLVGRVRFRASWEKLQHGFKCGKDSTISLEQLAELINKMGINERQVFLVVGESLVLRNMIKSKSDK